jgi:ABC-type arginine transport system permease subunit
MRHPNIYVFTFKTEMFGISQTDIFAIYIAINAAQRFKRSQLISQLYRTKIPGMPYLVAIFKMFKNCIIKVAMGIGKEAYAGHI